MLNKTDTLSSVNAGEASTGIWSRSNFLLTLGMVLAIAAYAFESLSVATAMPTIANELANDLGALSLYGWVFSAYTLATIIGLTVAGTEADSSGVARPFTVGVLLFVVGLLLAGLAPTMELLIVARAIQGLGGGLVGSIVYVIIGSKYPEQARPSMIALISSVYVIPNLIGPALAGVVVEQFGWRWIFLGIAPIMPLATALILPAIREPCIVTAGTRDWRKIGLAVRLATGVALIMTGMGNYQNVWLAISLSGIGAALALPAFRQMLPIGSLAASSISVALLVALLQNMAFFGVDAFVPFTLTNLRGQSVSSAGLALTAATVSWTISAWLQSRLTAFLSRRALVAIGLALITVGLVGVVVVLDPRLPVALALVVWGIAGLGMGFASPTLSLLAMELVPDDKQGTAISAMQIAGVLGIALGTGIGGVIIGNVETTANTSSAFAQWSVNIAIHTLLMVVALCVALWFARRLPGKAQATHSE